MKYRRWTDEGLIQVSADGCTWFTIGVWGARGVSP